MFIASDTDIGKKRSENQDRVHAEFLADNVAVAVVCDGMGGASSGGVASQLAIDAVVKRIKENFRKDMKPNSIRNLMLTSVHYANTIVYGKSKEDIDKNGMGTTCVAALVVDKTVYMVSVGDSRGYLLTKDGIAQITTDHTYVEMLYRSGQITKEEAKNHHMRNVITKAVGVESDVEVDYFELEENDNFAVLLCSDGLTNYCTDNMIYETVFGNNLDEAITELIGVGGMADVYKAVDVMENRTVAVKILKPEFSQNEEFLRRFRNESKAIAVLSHPNIVKIYDVGFSDEIQFIVMEYIDGITLKEFIEQQGVLRWKDALHFVTQILRALSFTEISNRRT